MAAKRLVLSLAFVYACGLALGQSADPRGYFPAGVNGWTLKATKAHDAVTIFDYMDGAAEPYMTYTYKQLYVGQYAKGDQELVVEMYDMGSPPEAYGAYTLEVEGTPTSVGNEALFSGGALRVWKGPYFIKIFSASAAPTPETDALAMGKAIAAKIPLAGQRPKLVAAIPASLKPSKFRYFHTNEIFSEIYYVSTKNVLELSPKTEAVWAECEVDSARPKVCVVRYPDAATRDRAWAGLCAAVFSQASAGKSAEPLYAEQLGSGLSAGIRKMTGPEGEILLALCFEAKNTQQCIQILEALCTGALPKGK